MMTIPKITLLTVLLVAMTGIACSLKTEPKPAAIPSRDDYIKAIPGPSDSVPVKLAQQGEVLVGYADCASCHKEDQKAVGPAFRDIAKRYPVNKQYIDYLAKKIISGGSRSWGFPVMPPNPRI